jgi:hypothetical protein
MAINIYFPKGIFASRSMEQAHVYLRLGDLRKSMAFFVYMSRTVPGGIGGGCEKIGVFLSRVR